MKKFLRSRVNQKCVHTSHKSQHSNIRFESLNDAADRAMNSPYQTREQQYDLLQSSVARWNEWRQSDYPFRPDLTDCHFENMNLSGANLDKTVLVNAVFKNTNLSHASMIGCNMNDATLDNCDLSYAVLSGARCGNTRFEVSDFSHARLFGVLLTEATLDCCLLVGANGKVQTSV